MNDNIEVTLLSKEEVRKSKILKEFRREFDISYWTRSMPSMHYSYSNYDTVYFLLSLSFAGYCSAKVNEVYGIRPVLKTANLERLIKDLKISYENGVEVVEYGEYPNLEEYINLEERISISDSLKPTGKSYYYPDTYSHNSYKVDKYLEYQCYGKKYAHLKYGLYAVRPVKFYIDREQNMLIAKDILFSSPINIDNKNYNGDFTTSQLYQFLNNEFINSLLPNLKKDNINSSNLEIEKELKGRSKVLKIF